MSLPELERYPPSSNGKKNKPHVPLDSQLETLSERKEYMDALK
jgi:hypothetical protein